MEMSNMGGYPLPHHHRERERERDERRYSVPHGPNAPMPPAASEDLHAWSIYRYIFTKMVNFLLTTRKALPTMHCETTKKRENLSMKSAIINLFNKRFKLFIFISK